MTGWEVLNNFVGGFPFVVTALFLTAALIALGMFIVGFGKYGINFLKYGFMLIVLDNSLEKRFDKLEAKIEAIETNHFGHLKNYLGILNGVLLDKQIIDNETKARLDNELRGM
jgi:hypothetical protein